MTAETSNAREWVLVPSEPTKEMEHEGIGVAEWTGDVKVIWSAMLAAAPPPAAARRDVRGLGYVPGRLDREAPARVWLQIDTTGDNDERDDAWPGPEHVTWQDESIGGLEIQYVRADLALAAEGVQAGEVEQRARGELRMADIREDAREALQQLRDRLADDEVSWRALCRLMPMLAAPPPALTAAQQQGQAVAEVKLHDGLLYGRLDADLPVGTKLYTAPPPMQQGGGEVEPDGYTSYGEFRWACDCDERQRREWTPVYLEPPSAPVGVIGDAIRHLSKWLDLNDCECESGHQCGRTEVEQTRDQLRALSQQPAPSAPVGVEAVAFTVDNGPGKVVGLEWNPYFPVSELRGRFPLYLAQQPAAVDEAMVERGTAAAIAASTRHARTSAVDAWRQLVREVLAAALATQHQEPKS